MLLFHINYLLHMYLYTSGSCPVQLVPLYCLRAAKGAKCLVRALYFDSPRDGDGLLSVCVCLCIAIGRHQREKEPSCSPSHFSAARNEGQRYERLYFQRAKVPFIENRLFSEMYSQSLPRSLLCAMKHAF